MLKQSLSLLSTGRAFPPKNAQEAATLQGILRGHPHKIPLRFQPLTTTNQLERIDGRLLMRSYVDGHPVETMPRFRANGKGRAVTSVSFSVPLRFDDLASILYNSTLSTERLSDADAVREVIAETLVNKGAIQVAKDKDLLRAALRTGAHDAPRLEACKRRITTLFTRANATRQARPGTAGTTHAA